MPHLKLKIESLTLPGQPLSADSGVPGIFKEALNERWQKQVRENIILEITLQSPSKSEWNNLGKRLLEELLQLGGYVGACIDGQIPREIVLNWLGHMQEPLKESVVELRWVTSLHSEMKGVTHTNFTWISMQPADAVSWLRTIWDTVESDWFDQGSDLMLSIYDINLPSLLQWEEPLTIQEFGKSLDWAQAWLVPLDGNLGFLIGLPLHCSLYEKLMKKEHEL